FVVGQVLAGLPGVVAVVSFAGQNEDEVARTGQLFDARSDDVSDAADDLRRRALGRPGGLLPFAHLGDADDRHWHRLIGCHNNRFLTRTEEEILLPPGVWPTLLPYPSPGRAGSPLR